MRKLLIILSIFFCINSYATNRYVASTGNDGNPGTIGSPYLTIGKVNTAALANDSIFFRSGDTFYGTLLPTKNGVYYGTYGGSTKAILTGFTTISGWTNEGNGIYSKVITAEDLTNMVTYNGVQSAMGRFPEGSYLKFQTVNGSTSITDNLLNDVPNWAGGEVVIRSTNFNISRNDVSGQVSGQITYTPVAAAGLQPIPNYGYFFQNNLQTLALGQRAGAWYHDIFSGKFYMYFGAVDPTTITVKVATLSNVVLSNAVDNVVIDNLAITGAINNTIKMQFGQDNWKIKNCDISFAGNENIEIRDNSTLDSIYNNNISFSNGYGIFSIGISTVVYNNTVTDIALIPGQSLAEGGSYTGIFCKGNGARIINNTVRRIGDHGIYVNPFDVSLIKNNFIDSTILTLNDGGAIYIPGINASTRTVDGNIMTNALGNTDGTNNSLPSGVGVYCDEFATRDSVVNNAIFNTVNAIKNNKGSSNYFHDNTTYDNIFSGDIEDDNTGGHVRNLSIRRNIFFQKITTQYGLKFYYPGSNDISLFGTADSNYYAKPIDDNLNFSLRQLSIGTVTKNLSGWQAFSNKDLHSKKSPKTITNVNQLHFTYNASNSAIKTYFTGFSRIDVAGTIYRDSATIPAWRSIVSIDSGVIATVVLPTANAGVDKSITLPTNSTSVTGTFTNGTGTSTVLSWSQISGPNTATNSNPNSATTTLGNLIQGTYTFLFTITNTAGSASDFMQVVVNPAAIVLPTANAGSDKAITLPTTSISATATAILGTGTLVSYTWVQISGPATATFGSGSSLTTTINSLTVAGTYSFKFTVLNSQGNSASDNMDVIVSPAIPPVNIPPTAVAGSNQTITLPTNSVTVNGSGSSDPDGTITGYQWTITGPNTPTNSTGSSVSTTFGSLIAGSYHARLRVTDNNGDTGVATLTITVNPAINVLPTAVAGVDQILTLPTNSTLLDGSGSSDPDGITAYLWRQISGPSTATNSNVNSATNTISNLIQGVYIYQLKVTGSNGSTDTAVDAIQITVNAALLPPTAVVNPIPNPIVTLPVNSTTIIGSGIGYNGATISSYLWTDVAGNPTTGTIASPASATTLTNNLLQGTYRYQLTVTDSNGLTGSQIITVTVLPVPPPNFPVLLKIH